MTSGRAGGISVRGRRRMIALLPFRRERSSPSSCTPILLCLSIVWTIVHHPCRELQPLLGGRSEGREARQEKPTFPPMTRYN